MDVVGGLRHQRVKVLVEVLAVHPLVVPALNDVPDVADYAIGDEAFAKFVEIEPERIGRPVGECLENLPGWMIAPDAAVHRYALTGLRSRFAHHRSVEDAVATVEPAVRAPGQTVEDVVLALERPAVEHHFGFADLGNVGVEVAGDEEQVGVAEQSQMPPKPSSMPLRLAPLSKTT